MADISGPTTSLPGSMRKPPAGTACDDHPHSVAVRRVTGEVDSFGAEYHDMCQVCLDAYQTANATADKSGTCDWCQCFHHHLRAHRDFEEGLAGRVYQVCDTCILNEQEREGW